ncbi:hypothetical protein [Borreliella kurtenbachii]|uniref:hypothetical protein n=1 Tax=Borreliella kurtenbachii TaxID=1196056 RepID=UPI00346208DC
MTGENIEKVKKQGKIRQETLKCAKELRVNEDYSTSDGTNTDNFAKKVIDDVLENIEEKLKKLNNEEE